MKLLALAFLILPLAFSQQLQPVSSIQADCGKYYPLQATGVSAIIDNRQAQCDGWIVSYSNFGFAPVSVLLQDAPIGNGVGIAGTFVNFAGTILTGYTNPATATDSAEIRATGYYPYVRVAVTLTGSGYFTGTIWGWKSNPNTSNVTVTGGGGCPGTTGTPCQVQQIGNSSVISGQQAVTAAAVALATNAVRNICVKALVGNTANVYIGPSAETIATGMELAPGDSYCGPLSNTNLIFVIAACCRTECLMDCHELKNAKRLNTGLARRLLAIGSVAAIFAGIALCQFPSFNHHSSGGGAAIDSSYKLFPTAASAANLGSGAGFISAGWQTDTNLVTPANGGAANTLNGIQLPKATGAHFAWLFVPVPVGWNATIGLISAYYLLFNASGTGTGTHDYALSCYIPGTTNISSAITWTAAVTATFNIVTAGVGAIDQPALTPPTCSPGTLAAPTGAMLMIRVIRENAGTATDPTVLTSFQVRLPHTVQ